MIEAMKQALEAFEDFVDDPRAQEQINASITALRQAIADFEKQEPVACDCNQGQVCHICDPIIPPKREWVGLTDEEVNAFVWNMPYEPGQAEIRAIEAKLKEKNT